MADIDKDKPADSDLLSQYPQNERNSRTAIETILAVDHKAGNNTADDGKHTIVQLLAQSTISGVAGQGALYTKDVGSGVIELFYKDAAGNEIQLTDAGVINEFDSGTNMLFNQASAPTGWTQDNSVNDHVLRVVDNTGTGAATGGSWTISGLSTGSAGNHNHTVSRDNWGTTGGSPSPSNALTQGRIVTGSGNVEIDEGLESITEAGNNRSTTSNGAHSHPVSHDGNWRPSHRDVIAATKD